MSILNVLEDTLLKKRKCIEIEVMDHVHVLDLCKLVAEYDQNLFLFTCASRQDGCRMHTNSSTCFGCSGSSCATWFRYDHKYTNPPSFTICPQGHIESNLFTFMQHSEIQKNTLLNKMTGLPVEENLSSLFFDAVGYESCFIGVMFPQVGRTTLGTGIFISCETACSLYKNFADFV